MTSILLTSTPRDLSLGKHVAKLWIALWRGPYFKEVLSLVNIKQGPKACQELHKQMQKLIVTRCSIAMTTDLIDTLISTLRQTQRYPTRYLDSWPKDALGKYLQPIKLNCLLQPVERTNQFLSYDKNQLSE